MSNITPTSQNTNTFLNPEEKEKEFSRAISLHRKLLSPEIHLAEKARLSWNNLSRNLEIASFQDHFSTTAKLETPQPRLRAKALSSRQIIPVKQQVPLSSTPLGQQHVSSLDETVDSIGQRQLAPSQNGYTWSNQNKVTDPLHKIMPFNPEYINLLEESLENKDYEEFLKNLTLRVKAYKSSHFQNEETAILYRLILKALPSLSFSQAKSLLEETLPSFLERTKDFADRQHDLALTCARLFEQEGTSKIDTIGLYTIALSIEKKSQLAVDYNKSIPLICQYLNVENFGKKIAKAKRMGNSDLFGQLLDDIKHLKLFYPDQQHIQSLYEKARDSLSNTELRAFLPFFPLIEEGLTKKANKAKGSIIEAFYQLWEDYVTQFNPLLLCSLTDFTKIRQFQASICTHFSTLFANSFLKIALALLGHSEGNFVLCGVGSYAYEWLCPYSDLEYFILFDNENDKQELRQLAELLDILVTSLGQSPLIFPCFSAANIRQGLHIDKGGNPHNQPDLIATLNDISTHLKPLDTQDKDYDPGTHQHTMKDGVVLFCTDQRLFSDYQERVKVILSTAATDAPSFYKTVGQRRAFLLLKKHLNDFKMAWASPPEELETIDLKDQYAKLLNHLLSTFALYFDIPEKNPLDIVDALSIFSRDTKVLLKQCLSAIYVIRCRAHLTARGQYENVKVDSLTQEEKHMLFMTYHLVLKPLYQIIAHSLSAPTLTWLFSENCLLQDSFKNQFLTLTDFQSPQFVYHLASFLGQEKASANMHFFYFNALCQKATLQPLRAAYLKGVQPFVTPRPNKEMLLFSLFNCAHVSIKENQDGYIIDAHFELLKLAEKGEKELTTLQVLKMIFENEEFKKPDGLILSNSIQLNSSNLTPFLHSGLKVLDVRNCPYLDSSIVGKIALCLSLEQLYLSGCSGIQYFEKGIFLGDPIKFPHLKILHLIACGQLSRINLIAPELEELKINNNYKLSTIKELIISEKAHVDYSNCPQLDYQKMLLLLYNEYL